MILLIIIAVAGALGGGIMTFAIGLPNSPCAGVTGTHRSFTIMVDYNGFNGSAMQQGNWPVITVNRCDMVRISLVNSDAQAHGFAIEYYAARGTDVLPLTQQPTSLQFLASRAGQFRVYCNVPCTRHSFMQNGLLIVS